MDTKHTPTPPYYVVDHPDGWTIQTKPTGAGECVAQQYGDATAETAAFIVKACNTHELLVAALEQVLALGANGPGRDVFARIAEEALAEVAAYETPSAQPAVAKLDMASPPHSCAAVAPPQTC